MKSSTNHHACLHGLCVFANQRVAKGTIENQDDEIVSCRDDCDENSVGECLSAVL